MTLVMSLFYFKWDLKVVTLLWEYLLSATFVH